MKVYYVELNENIMNDLYISSDYCDLITWFEYIKNNSCYRCFKEFLLSHPDNKHIIRMLVIYYLEIFERDYSNSYRKFKIKIFIK